jgi:pyridoxal phosphate enzyme (YggS family)
VLPVDEPSLTPDLIRERHERLRGRLRQAAERAGRDPDGFRIVAVTKGFGVEVVGMAVEAGLNLIGENRLQEALPKVAAVPTAEWHLVGHLQSNKARPAVDAFSWVHSVDDVSLLRRLETIAHDAGRRPQLLLQVNLSGEATKFGFDAEWFADEAAGAAGDGQLVAAIQALRHARLRGLMTMARASADDDEARATFRRLRELRDRLERAIGTPLPDLSMGMTADAEAAVAEGATLVRIGAALFGPRPG